MTEDDLIAFLNQLDNLSGDSREVVTDIRSKLDLIICISSEIDSLIISVEDNA